MCAPPSLRAPCPALVIERPFGRVRLMQRGEVEAANVWGPQPYILEQLGFRKLVDSRFIYLMIVAAGDTSHLLRHAAYLCDGMATFSRCPCGPGPLPLVKACRWARLTGAALVHIGQTRHVTGRAH